MVHKSILIPDPITYLDNVPVESFFSSLKNELVRNRQFANQAEARYAIAEYIDRFYNR